MTVTSKCSRADPCKGTDGTLEKQSAPNSIGEFKKKGQDAGFVLRSPAAVARRTGLRFLFVSDFGV